MSQPKVSTVSAYSIALMIITSVHHIYGAAIYHTPWRLHVLALSIPTIIATLFLNRMLKKREPHLRSWIYWMFFLITVIPSIAGIGIFEGLYNHVLKNILFFGGASDAMLDTLFPAPTYEMPNDLFFEITGVIQGIIVLPLILKLTALTKRLFKTA